MIAEMRRDTNAHVQSQKTVQVQSNYKKKQGVRVHVIVFINPRRMREGYGSRSVCVSVYLSVTTL